MPPRRLISIVGSVYLDEVELFSLSRPELGALVVHLFLHEMEMEGKDLYDWTYRKKMEELGLAAMFSFSFC